MSEESRQVRVFLSYARGDDEPFGRRLYDDLTARGFKVWFDRISMPSRELTFHQEIRDAVAACDRLVLVVGPKAVASDYVTQEWRFAYFEADKCVNPIVRLDGARPSGDRIDGYDLIPEDLKLLHAEDFRDDGRYAEHLENLARQLAEAPAPVGKLVAVPELPPHYRENREHLKALRDLLLLDLRKPVVVTGAAARVGLQGMGGIGKSVLACALARRPEVRRAFPDGVFWIALGQQPDVPELQRRLARELGDEALFSTAIEGRERLRRLLDSRAALLVLDDVWQREHAEAFNAIGPRGRLLLTTRDAGLVTALAARENHYQVQLPTQAEAESILAAAAQVEIGQLPAETREVVAECGRLPLALALCGGMVQGGTPWRDVLDALREHDLQSLSADHPAEAQHANAWKAMDVSIRVLPEEQRDRFAELAVFAIDARVPEAAVVTLWEHTAGLSPRGARKLLADFARRSLVQMSRAGSGEASPEGRITLHDLLHNFAEGMAARRFGSPAQLHERLIEAYRKKCPDGWPSGPDDGYFHGHLIHHLVVAGRAGEARPLLFDFEWLAARLNATDVNGLIGDYSELGAAIGADESQRNSPVRLVQGALRLSAHVLARDKSQLAGQLLGRLLGFEDSEIQSLMKQARTPSPRHGSHFLLPARSSLTPPGGPLLRTLEGHDSSVECCVVYADGRRVLSGCYDKTLKIWDLESGECLRTLEGYRPSIKRLSTLDGHSSSVSCCVVYADGRRALSGSWDNTLKVWDLELGECLRTLEGHGRQIESRSTLDGHGPSIEFLPALEVPFRSVNCCAVYADGRRALSGSQDNTLKVWDLESGECLRTLEGHGHWVNCCVVYADGRRALSGSDGKTLKVWDLESGECLRTLEGHGGHVSCCAVHAEGRRALSGSDDNTLKVWDLESGECLRTFEGHSSSVNCCVVYADGRRALSGSDDNTLKVWDLESGECLRTFEGHSSSVNCCVVYADGRRALSGSRDGTLKIWDLESDKCLRTLEGHDYKVTSCSVYPDGRRVLSGSTDSTLKVWDVESGECLRTLEGHGDWVNCCVVYADGRRALSGSGGGDLRPEGDKTLKVWDLESGECLRTLEGHGEHVSCCAVYAEGRRALSGSIDNTLKVWDLESGECLRTLKGDGYGVSCCAVYADGRRALSGCRGPDMVEVWDLESGERLRTLQGHGRPIERLSTIEGYHGSVECCVAYADGHRALSGSGPGMGSFSTALKVWDLESGERLRTLEGHDGRVTSCVVFADGRRALSASGDKTLKVWDLDAGRCLATFSGEAGIYSCATTPDGRRIVAGDSVGRLHFLRFMEGEKEAVGS